MSYTFKNIFDYTNKQLDDFISNNTDIKYETLADKRYMTIYFLYNRDLLSKKDIPYLFLPNFKSVMERATNVNELITQFIIITFNLAYHTQKNKLYGGSEDILTTMCQTSYPKTTGWSDTQGLSQCTLNASLLLAEQRPLIVGIQEGVNSVTPLIVDVMNKQVGENKYAYTNLNTCYFIYDISIGKPSYLNLTTVADANNKNEREMLVVYFPNIKLLAINLHAPHGANLKSEIELKINQLNLNLNPNRIIVTGDFNDGKGSLKELQILGQTLKQHGRPFKTCCTDSDYQYVGDYIFDSDYNKSGIYQIVKSDKLMSDHYPIIYMDN